MLWSSLYVHPSRRNVAMFFTPKLTFFVYIALKLSAVYSSIHFDEVEFYDPNKTLDESTSNGFICAHLGEECQISAQCCGVATCALPSWSEKAVCLVPGYKHDERFRNRFFALHHLQPADIQYIRDSYNTSQYDFLLTDLTFSAPPLEVANTSLGLAANHTMDDVSAEDLGEGGRNHSVEPVSIVEGAEYGHTENASLEETYEQNSTYFRNDLAGLSNHSIWSNAPLNETFLDKSFTINETYSLANSTYLSQNEGFDFKTHFMFLLINNTLKTSPSKFELKEFYDQITNTDRFKTVVEHLRAKLKEINELESNLNNQREHSTLKYIGKETDGSTTENIKPTEKPSKWNHVRRFFIHSQNQPINTSFPVKSNLKEVVEDVLKKHANADNLKMENTAIKPPRDYPEFLNDNEKFNKIFEDVDKIEDIIDNDRTINTFHNNKANEDGLIDYYNIDMPFSSFHDIPQRTVKMNDSLDSVFKDIGDTISSIMNNNNEGNQEQKGINDENNNGDSPTQYFASNFNKTTVTEERKISNKTHFWEKIHFWKVPQNLSIEVERSLKHFFFREKNQSTMKNENHSIPLKENYQFNLNSKNNQDTVTTSQMKGSEKNFDYLIDSSESEFSKTEELYNNSYIFMVHKEHLDEPAQLSSWKKVVNFFHREKGQPVTLDVNVQDIPGNSSSSRNSPSEFESVNNQNIVNSSKIIRLPENLMPQVLDQRQTNETEWFMEDFDDYEDKIGEHKSSDGSFLFFFK